MTKKKAEILSEPVPMPDIQHIRLEGEKFLKGLKVGDKVTVTLTGKVVELSTTYKASIGIKDPKVKVEGSTVWSELSKEEDEDEE